MPAGQKYWMDEGAFDGKLRYGNAGSSYPGEIGFIFRNNCLHAVRPIGSIRKLTVTFDGKEIAQEDAFIILRGQRIRFKELPTITDIWWNVREDADIRFVPETLPSPGSHEVSVRVEISHLQNTRIVDRKDVFGRIVENIDALLILEGDDA
jgi:hypothetical protein